jgi:poly-gamma-glutamate synthesis protein (capsule biosynthesis protein)
MAYIKRRILPVLLVVGVLFALTPLSAAHAEETQQTPEAHMSSWAREEVSAAFAAGLIAHSFNPGEDYAANITRLQLAEMTVAFIAAEQAQSAQALAEQFKLYPDIPAENTADLEDSDFATAAPTSGDPGAEAESDSAPEQSAGGEESTPALSELPELLTGSYADTKNPYAELALKLNLMNGYNGLFRPNDPVTRAEAAVVLRRCMEALGVHDANTAPQLFADSYEIPRWAVDSVKFVSGRTNPEGTPLMSGDSMVFHPGDPFTIEQTMITLLRMHESKTIEEIYADWLDTPGYNLVEVTMTFGGDCTFGRGKNFAYHRSFDEMYDLMGPDYFFSGIREFFEDDFTMVNFEGTLTNETASADKTYVFKGPPEYAEILPSGSIDAVTIANNHSMDYLAQGFADTVQNLSPYVAVSGYERMPIVTVKGVKIGLASNVGWLFDAAQKRFIEDAVRSLREAGADLVVFNYHWGVEGAYTSNAIQQAIARYCIDQGADLVVGHHPHVAQETETYKGKQIVYSLGNLVFGGNQNPGDKNCLLFRQAYIFDLDTHTVVSESHQPIAYRISSVSTRNDYHPVPAA